MKLRNQLRVANDQRLLKYRHQQVGELLRGAIRGGAKRRPVIATKNIIFGQVLFNDLETQVQINIRVECDDIAGHNVKLASGLQVKPTQFYRQVFGTMYDGWRRLNNRFEHFRNKLSRRVHNDGMTGDDGPKLHGLFVNLRYTVEFWYMIPDTCRMS